MARALLSLRSEGFSWSVLVGGAMLTVLGLMMLRHPLAGALALTLMAGALFFSSGIMRLGLAFTGSHRWLLLASGLVSIALGLWILLNPATATLQLLGILLGIQFITEGLTLVSIGRLRVMNESQDPAHV